MDKTENIKSLLDFFIAFPLHCKNSVLPHSYGNRILKNPYMKNNADFDWVSFSVFHKKTQIIQKDKKESLSVQRLFFIFIEETLKVNQFPACQEFLKV